MKIKLASVTLATAAAVVLATWSIAYRQGYRRGYSLGGRDEFLRWKQEPISLGPDWDGTIVGRRKPESHPPIISKSAPSFAVNGVSEIYPRPKQ